MSGLDDTERAALNRLLDESAVRAVITSYTYATDWLNRPVLASLFWPDAEIAVGPFKGDLAAFLPFVESLEQAYLRRLHMFSGERIALFGESAEAEVGCVILVRAAVAAGVQDEFMWGRYLFGLEKRTGAWKIVRLATIGNLREVLPARPGKESPLDRLGPDHPLFPRFG